jgi:hypothetical protein
VLNCVGLLFNGSPGGWPEYPLLSHPKTLILRHEPDQLEFNVDYRIPGSGKGGTGKVAEVFCICVFDVDGQVVGGEVSNCG